MRTTNLLLAIAVVLGTVPATQAETGRTPEQLAQASPPATPAPPPAATPPAQPAPAEKLTGMAAWNQLVGNTVVGKLDGKDYADYYLPDGTVKSMVESALVSGKWSLEGDKICFVYPNEPKECYGMEVAGDTATFTDASGMGIRGQILKGNAKNL